MRKGVSEREGGERRECVCVLCVCDRETSYTNSPASAPFCKLL